MMTIAGVFKTIALTGAAAAAAALLMVAALTLASEKVRAKPAFAQATGKGCPTCHTAPPALNGTGQKYKTNGYKF